MSIRTQYVVTVSRVDREAKQQAFNTARAAAQCAALLVVALDDCLSNAMTPAYWTVRQPCAAIGLSDSLRTWSVRVERCTTYRIKG